MKESMIIYESAYKAINYLPDEKLQLEAYKGLMEYQGCVWSELCRGGH